MTDDKTEENAGVQGGRSDVYVANLETSTQRSFDFQSVEEIIDEFTSMLNIEFERVEGTSKLNSLDFFFRLLFLGQVSTLLCKTGFTLFEE